MGGLTTTAILSIVDLESITNGTLPAVSFLLLVVGLVFYFPSLIEERKGEVSTMRIVVLITVLVFAVVYIKLGWVAAVLNSFVTGSTSSAWPLEARPFSGMRRMMRRRSLEIRMSNILH